MKITQKSDNFDVFDVFLYLKMRNDMGFGSREAKFGSQFLNFSQSNLKMMFLTHILVVIENFQAGLDRPVLSHENFKRLHMSFDESFQLIEVDRLPLVLFFDASSKLLHLFTEKLDHLVQLSLLLQTGDDHQEIVLLVLILSHLARHFLLHQKSVTILQNFGESLMGDVVLFGQSLVVGVYWKFWELGYGLFLRFLSVGGIFNRINSQKLCL